MEMHLCIYTSENCIGNFSGIRSKLLKMNNSSVFWQVEEFIGCVYYYDRSGMIYETQSSAILGLA